MIHGCTGGGHRGDHAPSGGGGVTSEAVWGGGSRTISDNDPFYARVTEI